MAVTEENETEYFSGSAASTAKFQMASSQSKTQMVADFSSTFKQISNLKSETSQNLIGIEEQSDELP